MSDDRSSNHCVDCCCARSWKALGINEYTGLSIPEHIKRLRAACKEAETVMMIVEPRSHKQEYLDALRTIRLALGTAVEEKADLCNCRLGDLETVCPIHTVNGPSTEDEVSHGKR